MFQARRLRQAARGDGGFTLVELIIYIATSVIVIVGIVALFQLLSQSWVRVQARARVEENVRIALERIDAEFQGSQAILEPAPGASGDSVTIDTGGSARNYEGYAWSENIGWISFNCVDGGPAWANCDQPTDSTLPAGLQEHFDNYAVTRSLDPLSGFERTDEALLGFAATEHLGYISFDCGSLPSDDSCSTTDYQVMVDAEGEYHGWAWGEGIGWVSFNCDNFGTTDPCGGPAGNWRVYETVSLSGAELHGWAWSENIGWISFNCAEQSVCGTTPYQVSVGLAGTLARFAVRSGSIIVTVAGITQTLTDDDVSITACDAPWTPNFFRLIVNPPPSRPAVQMCIQATYVGRGSTIVSYSTETLTTFQL